jgi:hypothetical protein
MNLVLAVEPDASQADRLTGLVRTLGANLQLVASSHAAIVAMNQRVPDVVVLGRTLADEQRTAIVTHLGSVVAASTHIRVLDIPDLNEPSLAEAFSRKMGVSFAASDYVRQQSDAGTVDPGWDSVTLDAPAATEDFRAADEELIEAEVEVRLKAELERLQAEAAQQQARELARVEADAAERRAREMARVEAEATRQRDMELARAEQELARKRDSAVADAEARAAVEVAAREALTAELDRVRRDNETQLAAEIRRVRNEAEQALATQRDQAQAQAERDREERIARARAEADAVRAAAEAAKALAIGEAQRVVEEAAARAQMAEDEVERVRAEANAQLKAAVAKARAESEDRLQEEVARAQRETEARLEAQLASVIGEAEQVRHAHREMSEDAAKVREEAARSARAAAEARLGAETTRIRAEANQRLEAEIARLRTEAARAQSVRVDEIPMFGKEPDGLSALIAATREALTGIRWDYVATAALIILVIVAGGIYLPRAVRTAAHTSSTLMGSAGKAAKAAAKEAAAVAPVVTRRAITAAGRAIPRSAAASTGGDAAGNTGNDQVADERQSASRDADDAGPGFMTVYSRIPMQVYVDGKRVAASDDGQLTVPNGTHRIEFVNDHFHYRSSTSLTIKPGGVQSYNVTLPTAQVRVTTTPGAEVFVEGERMGVAPLDPILVPIGTREIVARDANGEKRQVVEVKYGETLDLSLVPQAAGDSSGPAVPRLAPLSQSR